MFYLSIVLSGGYIWGLWVVECWVYILPFYTNNVQHLAQGYIVVVSDELKVVGMHLSKY